MKMNLKISLFVLTVLVITVHGQSSVPEGIKSCYRGNQYSPALRLPNSLDNLIFLIEKVETYLMQQSLTTDASAVATALLKRFQKNGIKDVIGADTVTADTNEEYQQEIIWALLPNTTSFSFPEGSLNQKEQCSLHWMLSTSVNMTLDYYFTYSYYGTEVWHPKLNGAIHAGRYGTLSGGPLLAGIAASSVQRTITVGDILNEYEKSRVDSNLLSQTIDPIVGATVAAELAQSTILYAYPQGAHAVLGPDGTWNGTNCATTYSLADNFTTAASTAELLGATDGMIIGKYLRSTIYNGGANIAPTLSQVLRSYYGRGLQYNSMSACDRRQQAQTYTNEMTPSGTGFGIAYKARGGNNQNQQFPDYQFIGTAVSGSVTNYTSRYLQSGTEFDCDTSIQNIPCQTQNDIIVVMDTSLSASTNSYQDQKNFIGGLIGRIGVYPNDSHVGVFTFGSIREPVQFLTTQSGADIRCQLQWYPSLYGTTDVLSTVRALQDKFRSIRNTQRNNNEAKVPGKVIIFIYLQSSVANGDQVKTAMDNLRREFPELTTLAVGTNKAALNYFVVRDSDIFIKTGEQISYNLDNVIKRLCTAPTTLEYKDCLYPNTESEKKLIGDTYIYPDTYQWIALNQQTINLSTSLSLDFSSTYGSTRICFTRSISYEAPSTDCFDTSPSLQRYNFGNPCNNYNANSCPAVYINIKGKSSSSSAERCNELACDSWNQAKVSITHTGAKCDSCQFLATLPVILVCFLWNRLSQYFY